MIIDEIALSLNPAISLRTAVHLLDIFGNAGAVFAASPEELTSKAMLRGDIAREICTKKYHARAEAELAHCSKNRISAVGASSPHYPPLLRECCDRPLVLYVCGNVGALAGPALAIVGTRSMTPYGATVCEQTVRGLAATQPPLTVVSGLAFGIDSTAHRSALENNLSTVAVLGNKLPRIYPKEHSWLAGKIVESGGALISEMHSQAHEGRANFVARNRIIAGMSQGTLIVESPEKGGSMITAEIASGYDRAVMAVPGRVTDRNSAGTNRLIRTMKAVAVCSAEDVVQELGLPSDKKNAKMPVPAAGNVQPTGDPVFDLIAGSLDGVTSDYISDRTGMAASGVLSSLFMLEMEGKIRKAPGGIYFKV